MKKNYSYPLLAVMVLLLATIAGKAQTTPAATTATDAPVFGIKFSGFLRNDVFYDTRQIVGLREGDLSLYPKDKSLDTNGKDINAAPTLTMLAITTRLSGAITGPDAFGAKTSGLFEAEFFGNNETDLNEFRLRHAWIKLDWTKTQLAIGQYWHPLFVTDCYPSVINFNTGMPFQPFNRSPQIRLTEKFGSVNLIAAIISERDFTSTAPSGYSATDPMRNSTIPNAHLQLQYKTEKFVAGAAFDYKSLRPVLASSALKKVSDERVNSSTFEAYVKAVTKPVIIKAEAIIGENLTDQVMLGGYLGYTVSGQLETYKPTKTNSFWFEIIGTGKKVIPGLFIGYTTNDGASANATAAYGRGIGISGRTVKQVMRVSPRVDFVSGKLKMGIEIEYTSAKYGTTDNAGKVTGATDDINYTRAMFTTTYSF